MFTLSKVRERQYQQFPMGKKNKLLKVVFKLGSFSHKEQKLTQSSLIKMRKRGLPGIQGKQKTEVAELSLPFPQKRVLLSQVISLLRAMLFRTLLFNQLYSSFLSSLLNYSAYFSTGPQMGALALILHGLRLQCKQFIDHNPQSLSE